MSIIIMAASSVESVLLIRILNVVMSAVEVVTSPDSFPFRLVWFVIANYFAVSDLPVFRDVCEFYEETCVGSWNISNSLKKSPTFVSKASFPKWL
jgi:hypothetical protein